MTEQQRVFPDLGTVSDVELHAHAMADEVNDPCSMAIGMKVGLSEMGLVRHVDAERGEHGWNVRVRLRLTSPGCQYFFYFRESMEEPLKAHPQIDQVEIQWDQVLDWTPEDLALSVKEKIAARQRLLHVHAKR